MIVLALVILGIRGLVILLLLRMTLWVTSLRPRRATVTIVACCSKLCRWPIARLSCWIRLRVRSRLPHLRTTPRRNICTGPDDIISDAAPPLALATVSSSSTLSQLRHKTRILGIKASARSRWGGSKLLRHLTRRRIGVRLHCAVASHMTGTTTDTTNNIGSKVALLGAVIFTMAYTTAVLTYLIFVVPECAVQCRQFSQLIAFVIVLTFGSRSGLDVLIGKRYENRTSHIATHSLNNPVDRFHTSSNFILRVSHNKAVQVFFSIISILVRLIFTLLYASFSSNANLGSTVSLHFLQTVTTWADQQAKEVDLREFLDWNVDLLRRSLGALLLVIFHRRAEVRVSFQRTIYKPNPLVFELLAIPDFAGVGSSTMAIVSRRRRRRPVEERVNRDEGWRWRTLHLSRSGGTKSFNLSLRLISSNRRWIA